MTNSHSITSGAIDAKVETIGRIEAIDPRLCKACQAQTREGDRFCRRCGVKQSDSAALAITRDDLSDSSPILDTGRLKLISMTVSPAEMNMIRPISGPLVKAVAVNISTDSLSLSYNPIVNKIILLAITILIWFIILLLSPLDAHATVKSASNRIPIN